MTKRVVNKDLIRNWLKNNGKYALERLAFESGCSASLLQKMISATYEKSPKLETIQGICKVTGYSIEELFPEKESA